VARCRRLWKFLPDARSRAAVEVAERFADGAATVAELLAAGQLARVAVKEREQSGHPEAVPIAALDATEAIAIYAGQRAVGWVERDTTPGESDCELIREIAGNSFQPAVLDPAWLRWDGGTIPKLARAAYEDRQLPEGTFHPDRLAVLADALEEAGCADATILDHLRGPGPHVRGCWVIGLILEKK
jgi:hypothetical protein